MPVATPRRLALRLLAPLAALLAAAPLAAQRADSAAGPPPVFLRAQRLVSEGNGPAGRALVDSVLAAARPGTEEYAEALYWKAALAPTAAEAERAYQRLTVEYPLSPRAGASLMRLAQLELARGDRAGARQRLERLVLEYQGSPLWPRAQYWLARSYMEDDRLPEACWSLARAKEVLTPDDRDLAAQLAQYEPRCADVTPRAPLSIVAGGGGDAPREPGRRGRRARAERDTTDRAGATPRDSARAAAGVAVRPLLPDAAPPATPPADAPAEEAPAVSDSDAAFTVQVGAFREAAAAERYVRELERKGIAARVVNGDLYRVHVGRFATRAEALRTANALKEQGITGFVAGVGGR